MGQTFFGLNLEYKKDLHKTLVNLSMNVEGFTYEVWYTMPVHMRNWYISLVREESERRKGYIEEARQKARTKR